MEIHGLIFEQMFSKFQCVSFSIREHQKILYTMMYIVWAHHVYVHVLWMIHGYSPSGSRLMRFSSSSQQPPCGVEKEHNHVAPVTCIMDDVHVCPQGLLIHQQSIWWHWRPEQSFSFFWGLRPDGSAWSVHTSILRTCSYIVAHGALALDLELARGVVHDLVVDKVHDVPEAPAANILVITIRIDN